MVSVVSKKRRECRSGEEEMVSTELQAGRGIVVMVLVGSGGVESPRMIIVFSKNVFQSKKKEKG